MNVMSYLSPHVQYLWFLISQTKQLAACVFFFTKHKVLAVLELNFVVQFFFMELTCVHFIDLLAFILKVPTYKKEKPSYL